MIRIDAIKKYREYLEKEIRGWGEAEARRRNANATDLEYLARIRREVLEAALIEYNKTFGGQNDMS